MMMRVTCKSVNNKFVINDVCIKKKKKRKRIKTIEDRANDQKCDWSVCGKPIQTHKPKPISGTLPKVCL